MRTERRRHRGFWATVADDPYRKLAAIGLAVLMWFFIDSRITKTITRKLRLVVSGQREVADALLESLTVVLPTDRVLGKRFVGPDGPIENVDVVISGPRFRVDAIEHEPLRLLVTTFLGREWGRKSGDTAPSEVEFVEFSATDIRKDMLTLREVRLDLVPTRVRLEVERVDHVGLPLKWDLVQVSAAGIEDRLRHETARFTPEEAVILGPAVGMEQLRRREGNDKLFRATLRAAGNDREASGALEIIGGSELGVSFERIPILQVQLRPQTEVFTLELQVQVDDLTLPQELRGRYASDLATLAVRVRAAGNLRATLTLLRDDPDPKKLQAWANENLRLFVYVRRPDLVGDVDRQAYLVPVGPLLGMLAPGDCLLEDPVVVKLRRKQ